MIKSTINSSLAHNYHDYITSLQNANVVMLGLHTIFHFCESNTRFLPKATSKPFWSGTKTPSNPSLSWQIFSTMPPASRYPVQTQKTGSDTKFVFLKYQSSVSQVQGQKNVWYDCLNPPSDPKLVPVQFRDSLKPPEQWHLSRTFLMSGSYANPFTWEQVKKGPFCDCWRFRFIPRPSPATTQHKPPIPR